MFVEQRSQERADMTSGFIFMSPGDHSSQLLHGWPYHRLLNSVYIGHSVRRMGSTRLDNKTMSKRTSRHVPMNSVEPLWAAILSHLRMYPL